MRRSTTKKIGLAVIIFFWFFSSVSIGGQKENDTENLQFIERRIHYYEQIMERYFRQNPVSKAQDVYKSAVDKYNALVQTTNATNKSNKSEIDENEKALKNLKEQIGEYDAKLAKKSTNQFIDRRNVLVERYNSQLKQLENEITQFNESVNQANRMLTIEKAKLEEISAALELEIKKYNDWWRLNKDEEFWEDLNLTFLNLFRKRRAGNHNFLLDQQVQKIRGIRKELGEYAIEKARSNDSGLVIVTAIVNRKEELHFIVDTGANYVSLTPVMVEVLGLKDNLGNVTNLNLAAGKTAWGQKIVYPHISVLGMEEQNVPGIAIPEKSVGIDGLLGRSFLKRFVVCFDFEQGPQIQLTPKSP
ncbi:MAG: retroviral-like aspartic protease family protein [Desulfobacterales bacterium]|jgi:hypothetical protein